MEETGEAQLRRIRIRVEDFSEEKWQQRDGELEKAIRERIKPEQITEAITNVERFHEDLAKTIRAVFKEEMKLPRKARSVDPFEHFLLANIGHPEMDRLLTAVEQKNEQTVDKLMRRIGADGWRAYLKSVNKNDARVPSASHISLEPRGESSRASSRLTRRRWWTTGETLSCLTKRRRALSRRRSRKDSRRRAC